MSHARFFFLVNRNCPNCVCYSLCAFVCRLIRTGTTNSVAIVSVIAHTNMLIANASSPCAPRLIVMLDHNLARTLYTLLSSKINVDELCYAFQPASDLLKSAKSATYDGTTIVCERPPRY